MRGLKDRVAIVTGGASGIGLAVVERFIEQGARVCAVDRDGDKLSALASLGDVLPFQCDVTSDDAPAAIVGAALERFGKLDILVNVAGRGSSPSAHETSDVDWDEWQAVNLRSTFRLSRDALPALRETRGTIVNMASTLGLSGYRGNAAYSAAKAGVIGLTRQMAVDYAGDGIRVNAVAPGIILTPSTAERMKMRAFRSQVVGTSPLGRPGTAEEVAGTVVFLCSDDAGYITGQTIAVDGGATSSCFIGRDIMDHWVSSMQASGET
ncbi:SDR family oxidoreductase [Sphingobium sp.]|uniref:SDR family NAD(P)-dependent oxidoreductase n=1 Tax=Sphingobium sp. TaxID=1912891 RepID=UPI0028BD4877|nr:SDR family oxidoreductase [Sphingobium sp.]